MGFSAIPPWPDFPLLLQTLEKFTAHADAAIMSNEAPWDSLLAGVPPDAFVRRQQLPLAQYYRGKGLRVWVYLDPANGLNRAGESDPLVAAGRSITEPAIQQLYRDYAVALDTLIRPDVFGVVLETNLIRAASPAPLYSAIRQVANDAAADIRSHDAVVQLSASVQVETAWGKFTGSGYQGVDTDFADFPFIQWLGLSSYPYFVWPEPASLPDDYYSRLLIGHDVPVGVVEGRLDVRELQHGGVHAGEAAGLLGPPRAIARQRQREGLVPADVHRLPAHRMAAGHSGGPAAVLALGRCGQRAHGEARAFELGREPRTPLH
jgi:hypothetical protein